MRSRLSWFLVCSMFACLLMQLTSAADTDQSDDAGAVNSASTPASNTTTGPDSGAHSAGYGLLYLTSAFFCSILVYLS